MQQSILKLDKRKCYLPLESAMLVYCLSRLVFTVLEGADADGVRLLLAAVDADGVRSLAAVCWTGTILSTRRVLVDVSRDD